MSSRISTASWVDLDADLDAGLDAGLAGWIEPLVPLRSRVHRNGSRPFVDIELPDVETLESLAPEEMENLGDGCTSGADEADVSDDSEDEDRSGAAAIAWAVAYRDGLALGRSEGYAQGLAEGRRQGSFEARNEGRAVAERAVAAMSLQIDTVLVALDEMVEKVAGEATSLGLGVAEAVLDNELRTSTNPGADAIARAVHLLPDSASGGSDRLRIHLNPGDVEGLGDVDTAGLAGRAVEIVADDEVASGSCKMELGAMRLDASVGAALARVRAVLSC
ncbi:MAG: FliH/SctL family protein [Microthrixaceae bacterium]